MTLLCDILLGRYAVMQDLDCNAIYGPGQTSMISQSVRLGKSCLVKYL